MRRRDVGIAIAVGVGLLLFILVFGSGTAHPIGNFIETTLFRNWAAGVALVVVAVLLHVLGRWPAVTRVVGFLGIAWVTFMVSYDVLLLLLVLYAVLFGGGFGY